MKALKEEKVDTLFAYPGGQAIDLFNALYGTEGINVILPRHEQGLIHAADGYSRSTGKVGVCLVTSGPGATNLVTGIATANYDSVPRLKRHWNAWGARINHYSFWRRSQHCSCRQGNDKTGRKNWYTGCNYDYGKRCRSNQSSSIYRQSWYPWHSGKSYNLNSLTVGSTEDISISRMTVEVWQLRLSGIASNMIVC